MEQLSVVFGAGTAAARVATRGSTIGGARIPRDSKEGRREFGRRMEMRRISEEDPKQLKALRRGWCLGSKEFRQELLAAMHERAGAHHGGEERKEADEAWARRLLAGDLKREGWVIADLAQRRKGDAGKIRMACRLRTETTMTLSWIAKELNMGTAGSLANLLRKKK